MIRRNTFLGAHGAQQNDGQRVQMRGDGGAIPIGMRWLHCKHVHMIGVCTRDCGKIWCIDDRSSNDSCCCCVWIGSAHNRHRCGKSGEAANDVVALLLSLISHNS